MKKLSLFPILFFGMVLGGFWLLFAGSVWGESPDLFEPVASPQKFSPPDDPTIVRARPVTVDFDVLLGNAAGKLPGDSQLVRLNLFDDVAFEAVLEPEKSGWGGARIRSGYVDGVPNSEVTLVFQEGLMAGNIAVSRNFYQIRFVEDGLHAVYEIDQRAFPEELDPVVPTDLTSGPAAGTTGDVSGLDDCSTIDIMVLYTDDARAYVGGTTAMNNLVNLAVSETNTGYANSGVTQRVNLVYSAEVSYDESSFDWSTTLSRLKGKTDGYMDHIHGWRDTYRADAVSLIVRNTASCGIAYIMTSLSSSFESLAFSVVSWNCATGYYTLAHEMGHNFGSAHDRANASIAGVYNYSYGYQAPDEAFRTIMSYDCPGGCTRVNYWSNPNIYYGGQPMGVVYTDPNAADNRRSLNNTACTVANWRSTSGTAPSAPAGVTATDGTYADRVGVSWNSAAGATSYRVYRATSSTGAKSHIGSPTGTTFDDTTAAAGTTYYYWVTACNNYGCSGYSSYDTGYRASAGICTPDYSLSCGGSDTWSTGGSGSTDQIDSYSCSGWNESGPEYTYTFVPDSTGPVTVTLSNMSVDLDIFVLDGGGGICNAVNCVTHGDTTVSFTGQSGHTYYLVVDGYNGASGSYTIDVACSGLPPAAPASLSASDGTYTGWVRVNWGSSAEATSYTVWRATSSTGTKTQVGTAISTMFDDTTAVAGTTYYYWVTACNSWGCSGFSSYDTGYRSITPASVVINEIDPGNPDWIELHNPGSQAVTMTGWHFIAYSGGGPVDADYTFPSFTLQPGAYVVLHESSGTGTATDLYLDSSISWVSSGACALTDGSSGVDFMRFGSSTVMPPAGTTWTGTNPAGPATGLTVARSPNGADTNDGGDWCTQSASRGGQNLVCLPTPASFPFSDGFESGSLGSMWSEYATNEGRVRVSTGYPCAGSYSVLLDDSVGNTVYSYAAAVLAIDLSGQSEVQLDFSWRDFSDEDHSDDGVFLSDDWGVTWGRVMNFTGIQNMCRRESLDLDALAAANGLALNDHFMIKFQFYDNYPISSDGYGIDDVQVQAGISRDFEVFLPVILKGW